MLKGLVQLSVLGSSIVVNTVSMEPEQMYTMYPATSGAKLGCQETVACPVRESTSTATICGGGGSSWSETSIEAWLDWWVHPPSSVNVTRYVTKPSHCVTGKEVLELPRSQGADAITVHEPSGKSCSTA